MFTIDYGSVDEENNRIVHLNKPVNFYLDKPTNLKDVMELINLIGGMELDSTKISSINYDFHDIVYLKQKLLKYNEKIYNNEFAYKVINILINFIEEGKKGW